MQLCSWLNANQQSQQRGWGAKCGMVLRGSGTFYGGIQVLSLQVGPDRFTR